MPLQSVCAALWNTETGGSGSYNGNQNNANKPKGCSRNGDNFVFNTNSGAATAGYLTICGLPTDSGVDTSDCYYHPMPPPSPPPPAPPPPSPPPPTPPPPSPPPPPSAPPSTPPAPPPPPPPTGPPPPNDGTATTIGIVIGIAAAAIFAFLAIGFAVRTLYRKHVLAERQRKWRIKRLFLDMDTDDSGFLEVEELEQMFVWFKNNLPDDDEHHMPWITKLWNALGSMADRAAPESGPNDDSSSTISTTKEPAEPTKAIDASLSKAETTHAVEGSKMDVAAFMTWYLSTTSSFPSVAKHKVLEALEEYVAKEASAVKVWRMSGSTRTLSLCCHAALTFPPPDATALPAMGP